MNTLIKIFKNEIITILKDSGSLLVMVIGALMYSFAYMVPFSNHILTEVPIGIIDNDNSSLSREFVRNLDSSEFVKVASRPIDVEDAKEQFYKNEIRAYILIPENFERDIYRGGNSSIAAFEDSAYMIIYKQVAAGVLTTAGTMSAKLEVGKFMKKGLSKQQAMSVKLPFEFVQMPLFNPIGSYQNYIYPIVLILILQQTMLVGTGLLGGTLRERFKRGDVSSFCAFSNNPAEIVTGKALAYSAFYLGHSMLYFLVLPALLCYRMSYNLPVLLLILLPFLFAISLLGQTLVYFFAQRESSLLALVVTSLPMIFLPGFVWPKESIPSWLLVFSKFIPATPTIDGLVRVNQMDATFVQVQHDFWLLIALCVLYFYLACRVTKRLCN